MGVAALGAAQPAADVRANVMARSAGAKGE